MTQSFDTLIESLLSEMMPADLTGGFGPTVKKVAQKVKELPGKSQHWGPLQKLDQKAREEITAAIIKKVFADNDENTYSLAVDNMEQLKSAISSAIREVAADHPEFKATSKWAAKFLSDRLANKELLGNVVFTSTSGEKLAKKDVTQKEVKKALNEGALLSAIKPSLQGEVKVAVEALETMLIDQLSAAGLKRNAEKLAYCVIDIIDAAKNEQNNEPSEY